VSDAVVQMVLLMLSAVDVSPVEGLLFVDWATLFKISLRTDHAKTIHFNARKKYLFRVLVDGEPVCEQEVGQQPVCPGIEHVVNGNEVTVWRRVDRE
jgi:hypothetical protein